MSAEMDAVERHPTGNFGTAAEPGTITVPLSAYTVNRETGEERCIFDEGSDMAEKDWVTCPNCKGTGRDCMAYSFAGICGQCIGTGRVAAPTKADEE